MTKPQKAANHKRDDQRASLRQRRDALRLSRKTVAADLRVDPSTIQRWELPPGDEHHRHISDAELERLIRYYDSREAMKSGAIQSVASDSTDPLALFHRLKAHLKNRNAQRAPQSEIEEISAQMRLAAQPMRENARDVTIADTMIEHMIRDAIKESSPPADWDD